MSERGIRVGSLRWATCLAVVALAGCGARSFVTPGPNGTLLVAGSSGRVATGAEEKARLVKNADEYCQRRGKSAVVVASSQSDATSGTLAAPGKLARATVEFRCQ